MNFKARIICVGLFVSCNLQDIETADYRRHSGHIEHLYLGKVTLPFRKRSALYLEISNAYKPVVGFTAHGLAEFIVICDSLILIIAKNKLPSLHRLGTEHTII